MASDERKTMREAACAGCCKAFTDGVKKEVKSGKPKASRLRRLFNSLMKALLFIPMNTSASGILLRRARQRDAKRRPAKRRK